MTRVFTKRIILNSFWLSVLLHILLFTFFATVVIFPVPDIQKHPTLQVPAYVYKGAIKPIAENTTVSDATAADPSKIKPTPTKNKPFKQTKSKYGLSPAALWSSTRSVLQASQMEALQSLQSSQPIYMIGDDNEAPDPLMKLVGQSLSAHFKYPEMAGKFGIRGRVLIGMTLHPEGYFSHVAIVSSSHNADLDGAALYAVNKAPRVAGADRFLIAPKHFVVGFIFH